MPFWWLLTGFFCALKAEQDNRQKEVEEENKKMRKLLKDVKNYGRKNSKLQSNKMPR
jgi:hypothetical protein